MYSNCLLWVFWKYPHLLYKWLKAGRPEKKEPEITVRPSRLSPWQIPHFEVLYFEDNQWKRTGFVPVDKTPLKWYQVWRVIVFKGTVEVSDAINK